MRNFKGLVIGLIVGLMVGTPSAYAAQAKWGKYRGLQTGEVLVCEKERGVLAVEKDVHRVKGKTYGVAWCNTRNVYRR